jgi:hypothetical protein
MTELFAFDAINVLIQLSQTDRTFDGIYEKNKDLNLVHPRLLIVIVESIDPRYKHEQ